MKNVNELRYNPYSNLSNIFRFSNTKLIERESDATHTIEMQLLALWIIEDIEKYYGKPMINEEKLICKILHHDLDELCLGDIPRSVKYHDDTFHEMIESISADLLKQRGVPQSRLIKVREAKNTNDPESVLTSLIDIIQCNFKLKTEMELQGTQIIKDRYLEACKTLMYHFDKAIDGEAGKSIRDYLIHMKNCFFEPKL